MASTLDHKCPNCDAVLKFNPHGQNWKCEYCRSEFNLEQLEEFEKKSNKELSKKSKKEYDMDIYTCSNCGAAIIADPNVSATSCVYCKNTTILKNKLQDEFSPDYLIPFRFTKEDAIEAFKKIGRKRPFMPKEFNKKENIEEMSGIYIPFWLYDYDVKGEVDFSCKRVTHWTSGDYSYTKTDTYSVERGGDASFSNVPVDGSLRFDNSIMNSIEPFNYEDMTDFNYSYLSGFLAEKYDVDKEEAKKDANSRVSSSFENVMKNDVKGYTTVVTTKKNINCDNGKIKYVLLPVWMLNIKYKDKIHTFAMNGQTGKLIGDIPIDKKKAFLYWILITLITFGICFGIAFLIRGKI